MGAQSRLVTFVCIQRGVSIGADTKSYSTSQEILEYFRAIAKKYELYKYIKLNHMVQSASWDEGEGVWRIKIKNLATGEIVEDWGHIFINGCGILKYVVA